MLAVIVGNSNCVLRRGFGATLVDRLAAEGYDVVNLSVGGSCSLFHIYVWHERRALLEQADLIVLDSMIIDISHHRQRFLSSEQVQRSVDHMYALYSTLPGRVVSVLFPSLRYVDSFRDLEVYRLHRASVLRHGVDVLDLYRLVAELGDTADDVFRNDNHLRPRFAAGIAAQLCDVLGRAGAPGRERRPATRTLAEDPYRCVRVDEEPFDRLERVTHASAHTSRTAAVLDRAVPLRQLAGMVAMGAFHWNKDGESRLAIRGSGAPYVKQLRGEFALFAAFTAEPLIEADDTLTFAAEDTAVTEPPRIDAPVLQPHLLGLLVRRPGADLIVGGAPGPGNDLTPLVELRALTGAASDRAADGAGDQR